MPRKEVILYGLLAIVVALILYARFYIVPTL